ncbi:helix-turn-helix transcriptional regulator [Acinetobacter oleivorans]|uniref:TetR/AcrR family transcriptional regulator n=1 Tax=Acinetobacter oleivorans TaxID=1148157 RepID=UPI0019004E49|nr:TetR/AcrR family transcriptional regulator [Acinetobacter oleivorans]MBJ9420008.1 helix-turn-helix transcriptional regulator [Acinetobacter oleivorans]
MDVKDKKRGRPIRGKDSLDKDVIITTAKALMLEDGKTPSIRQLALALQVDAMAMYYYFKNKEDLLEAVTISLVNEVYSPSNRGGWEGELEQLCFSYLILLKQYPGLLETLLGMTSTGPATVFRSRYLKIISDLNLGDQIETQSLNLLVDYLHGFALAMKYNQSKEHLLIEDIRGPLSLIQRILVKI